MGARVGGAAVDLRGGVRVHAGGRLRAGRQKLPDIHLAGPAGRDGLGVGGVAEHGLRRAGHDHGAQDRAVHAGRRAAGCAPDLAAACHCCALSKLYAAQHQAQRGTLSFRLTRHACLALLLAGARHMEPWQSQSCMPSCSPCSSFTLCKVMACLAPCAGYAILGPYARGQGWAPGAIMDWKDGATGWILWVSLAIMLGDSLTSLSILILNSAASCSKCAPGSMHPPQIIAHPETCIPCYAPCVFCCMLAIKVPHPSKTCL